MKQNQTQRKYKRIKKEIIKQVTESIMSDEIIIKDIKISGKKSKKFSGDSGSCQRNGKNN